MSIDWCNQDVDNRRNKAEDKKCLHCGFIHNNCQDGVCPTCQERNMPGRQEIIKRQEARNRLYIGSTF